MNKRMRYTAVLLIMGVGLIFLTRCNPKERLFIQSEQGQFALGQDEARRLFPEASEYALVRNGLYMVTDGSGRLLGFLAYGPPAQANIHGFAGKVPFLAGLDPEMNITAVHMLENSETPSYSTRVYENLKEAWTGLAPWQAAVAEVDGVTGATITSAALIEGVRLTMAETAGLLPGDEFYTVVRRGTIIPQIALILFLSACLLLSFTPLNSPRHRLAINIAGVAIPGLLTASMLSLALIEGWLRGSFAMQVHWAIFIVFVTALATALLTGKNFYCSAFCPFGCAQYLAGRISKKKYHTGRVANRLSRYLRVSLILTAAIIFIQGTAVSLSLLEPFLFFRWPYAGRITRIMAVVFLLAAVKINRPWCRICPTGGIIEAFRYIKRRFL